MAESDLKKQFRGVMEELAGDDSDIGSMHDWLPALTAFAREFAAPGFECVMRGLPPTPALRWPGVEGIEKAWEDYGGSFEGIRIRLIEIRESATHVVVIVDQQATTRHGSVEISQPSAVVVEFGDGQVKRVEFHLDRAEALRVAGLGDDQRPGVPARPGTAGRS